MTKYYLHFVAWCKSSCHDCSMGTVSSLGHVSRGEMKTLLCTRPVALIRKEKGPQEGHLQRDAAGMRFSFIMTVVSVGCVWPPNQLLRSRFQPAFPREDRGGTHPIGSVSQPTGPCQRCHRWVSWLKKELHATCFASSLWPSDTFSRFWPDKAYLSRGYKPIIPTWIEINGPTFVLSHREALPASRGCLCLLRPEQPASCSGRRIAFCGLWRLQSINYTIEFSYLSEALNTYEQRRRPFRVKKRGKEDLLHYETLLLWTFHLP